MKRKLISESRAVQLALAATLTIPLVLAAGCSKNRAHASGTEPPEAAAPIVGITPVAVRPLERQLTVSSELVPFQEIDVYAKQSGFVNDLRVDYGTRVKKGDVMAVLEIPELEQLIAQDEAAIRSANDQVTHAQNELKRLKAQYENIAHPFYLRLKAVADKQKGLIAQQEIDDAAGKDLAAAAQVDAGESALLAAESQRDQAISKKQQDQVLFDYRKITAPFSGVVTQRYANQGTLMQAGTSSSTQALPLVRLSEDDVFRLVIPVPESYVKYIRIGDPVKVAVPSLGKQFTGNVQRFSVDVTQDTRTMHTEVDIENPRRVLMPGLYAEATLTLERKASALVVPVQAVSQNGNEAAVLVVDMNNRIQNRRIELGLQNPNEAQVISGLNEGDRVVVSDRSGLRPGEEVRPQPVEPMHYQGEAGH
ncbi:MAG TPA: efflux RND transporter periplasmic adaptor subunit [Bryobacteraceae bacterium]|nr:efflux RND transporter periplasmic adaptor subunit [Bryobacteraceae bacterium]